MSNSPDLKAITEKFFHRLRCSRRRRHAGLCADGAQGRYFPTARRASCRFEAALNKSGAACWERCRISESRVDEMIQAEGNIVVVQALLGVPCGGCPGLVTRASSDRIAHAYIIRYDRPADHAPGLLLGQHRHQRIMASAL